MSEQTIKLLSLVVGAILATFGWIRNDLTFLVPAMIISPIGMVLNDLAFSAVNIQLTNVLYNLIMLGVVSIISIIISFRLGKIVKVDTNVLKKIDNFNEKKWLHLIISIIVGLFTAVCLNNPNPLTKISGIIAGMAVTILTPLVDIGVVSNLESQNDKTIISNDLKIYITNVAGFVLGASAVHYYLKNK